MNKQDLAGYLLGRAMTETFSTGGAIYKLNEKHHYYKHRVQLEPIIKEKLMELEEGIIEKKIIDFIHNHQSKDQLFDGRPIKGKILLPQTVSIDYNQNSKDMNLIILPINFRNDLVGIITLYRTSRYDNLYDWTTLTPVILALGHYFMIKHNFHQISKSKDNETKACSN